MSIRAESFSMDLYEDFIDAHALVAAACRLIEAGGEEDQEIACLTLRQGVDALTEVGFRIEEADRLLQRDAHRKACAPRGQASSGTVIPFPFPASPVQDPPPS